MHHWTRKFRISFIAAILLCHLSPLSRAGETGIPLFHRPAYQAELTALERLISEGQYERAELAIRQRLRRFQDSAAHHALLAAALAGQGRIKSARASLEKAIALDVSSATIDRLRPLLAELTPAGLPGRPAEAAGLSAGGAANTEPGRVRDQTASVDIGNTVWDPQPGRLQSYFRFEPPQPGDSPVQTADDAGAKRLNQLFRAGLAAGNHGDLYDNRDGDHSTLKRQDMPQLSFVEYGPEARQAKLHTGVNPGLFYNAITFGNSSMAVTGGPFWRSQPRLALTRAGGGETFYQQYARNHLYIFPEHRDHDPEHGDLIPANTPYLLISAGSSGSDQPLMRAVASILAAFKPEVKDFLRRRNLVMPTVQMIFRRGQNSMSGDAAYLSGAAHPSVFDGRNINLPEMIERANRMNSADIPPMVRLSVLEEPDHQPGIDIFDPASEKLFDTPAAIARIIRSTDFSHRMRISAAETVDPNGRPLTFHWVVLRGNAAKIEIRPKNVQSSDVELTVPWHEPASVPGQPTLSSNRVDIGIFAHNGVHYSAPSFVSFFYPANQWREYDADGRIKFADYYRSRYSKRYTDPLLYPLRDWSDRYEYDQSGRLIGWIRERAGGQSRFTRHGGKVTEIDKFGRPLKAVVIRYRLRTGPGGVSRIVEQPTRQTFHYQYSAEDDRLGRIVDPN